MVVVDGILHRCIDEIEGMAAATSGLIFPQMVKKVGRIFCLRFAYKGER